MDGTQFCNVGKAKEKKRCATDVTSFNTYTNKYRLMLIAVNRDRINV